MRETSAERERQPVMLSLLEDVFHFDNLHFRILLNA